MMLVLKLNYGSTFQAIARGEPKATKLPKIDRWPKGSGIAGKRKAKEGR
jgi:hypothetical protein